MTIDLIMQAICSKFAQSGFRSHAKINYKKYIMFPPNLHKIGKLYVNYMVNYIWELSHC